ncbi:winged helix-turn-helix domain-containing protein, partial [Enterobacter hormaechei]|uniref:winged helix-turn-helix domain-containing protein n=1 Tax=Enterobacter hormaechei TaxID=158836 RepID=UPI00114367A6
MATFKLYINDNTIHYHDKMIGRINFSECEILKALLQNQGVVVSRTQLLEVAWPGKIVSSNSVSMAIKNLRECFTSQGFDDVIITHVKKGFSWNKEHSIEIVNNIFFDNSRNTMKLGKVRT